MEDRNGVISRAERRRLRLLLELDEIDEFLRIARKLEREGTADIDELLDGDIDLERVSYLDDRRRQH